MGAEMRSRGAVIVCGCRVWWGRFGQQLTKQYVQSAWGFQARALRRLKGRDVDSQRVNKVRRTKDRACQCKVLPITKRVRRLN